MQLVVSRLGLVQCLYTEAIDLSALGALTITRASHVEPDADGRWWADLAPVRGPRLGPFDRRSQALAAESRWLERHCLHPCMEVEDLFRHEVVLHNPDERRSP
jgi:hypothetical protein